MEVAQEKKRLPPPSSDVTIQSELGLGEMADKLLDATRNLYSKTFISKYEVVTLNRAIRAAVDYYHSPVLLNWVDSYLNLKMSEEGRQVNAVTGPYQALVKWWTEQRHKDQGERRF